MRERYFDVTPGRYGEAVKPKPARGEFLEFLAREALFEGEMALRRGATESLSVSAVQHVLCDSSQSDFRVSCF